MSDDTAEQATPTDDGGESNNVKRMREQIESLKAENDTLNGRVRRTAFEAAGLDPERGIGKAVFQTYDGEATAENIREFASSEYDWKPSQQATIDPAQQRARALGQMGTTEEAKDRLQQADQKSAEGNWSEAGRLKDSELLAIAQKRGF